jgi:hypothetical protein
MKIKMVCPKNRKCNSSCNHHGNHNEIKTECIPKWDGCPKCKEIKKGKKDEKNKAI